MSISPQQQCIHQPPGSSPSHRSQQVGMEQVVRRAGHVRHREEDVLDLQGGVWIKIG